MLNKVQRWRLDSFGPRQGPRHGNKPSGEFLEELREYEFLEKDAVPRNEL